MSRIEGSKEVWGWMTREQMEKRNGHILELALMGKSDEEIAEMVDLSKARVWQILRDVR